jgi:hypothetical protein
MESAKVLSSLNWQKELNSDEREVCHTQAALFGLCQDKLHCDAFNFADSFMRSDVAVKMDAKPSDYYEANPFEMLSTLPETINLKPHKDEKSAAALHWIGYLYRYWALMGLSSKNIIKLAPVERAYVAYDSLHTLDTRQAISLFIERAN